MCFFSRSPDCEEHKHALTNHAEVVPAEVVNAPPPVTTEETSTEASSSSGKILPLILSAIVSFFKGR
ncbi:hypothetical protein Aduo_016461 [Ancylostoma duodenale]